MSLSQWSNLVFFVAGIYWIYRGSMLLSQSLHHEQHIAWYKRFKLTRSLFLLFLGLGAMITNGVLFTGAAMPLGDTGWDLALGLLLVPMLLFGILSWCNASHISPRNGHEAS